MIDQQSSGLSAKVRDLWHSNQDLLRNAGSLAATTGLTSIFGFVFTIVAARSFTAQAVGYGNTAINEMQLFGAIGMLGLGTMLIGELPKRARNRGGLFAAALTTSSVGSALLGLVFALIIGLFFTKQLPGIGGSAGQLLLFVAGTALTGATLVFDEGTIGLLRGGVQVWRNLAIAAIKLATLPVAAVLLHDKFGVGLSASYVVGMVGSVIVAAAMLVRSGSRVLYRPDWQQLRRLLPVAVSHNWLNLALATPVKIIPIIVTVAVGPKESAVFYVAFMISSLLFMVPVHLGTVLFALASASPEVIAEKLRFVLRVSLMIGLPVMAVLAVSAHFMLGFYDTPANHSIYSHDGTLPLWLLIISYIPQMPQAQYIAVSRATNKVGRAAALICVFAVTEFTAIFIGGTLGGLDGLSFAYLGVMIVEGAITAPTVLRAAAVRTAAATGEFPAAPAGARAATPARTAAGPLARATGPLTRVTGELLRLTTALPTPGSPERQESGLAALFAIASATVASEGHTLDVATEVWRTGAFPAIPADATRPRATVQVPASPDLVGGGTRQPPPVPRADRERQDPGYGRRQQAGVDALIAIATRTPTNDS